MIEEDIRDLESCLRDLVDILNSTVFKDTGKYLDISGTNTWDSGITLKEAQDE